MSDTIEPAMTNEEWADVIPAIPVPFAGDRVGTIIESVFKREAHYQSEVRRKLIALLNHALPEEDPRKITREKIEALRICVQSWGGMQSEETEAANVAFLDALESYLPPEIT